MYCYGCMRPLAPDLESREASGAAAADEGPGMVLRCQLCRRLYCFECDAYIHESLHNCPGCECGGTAVAAATGQAGGQRQANGTG